MHAALWRALCELFPALTSYRVTHTWGGALGIARGWMAFVGHHPAEERVTGRPARTGKLLEPLTSGP